ncbi:MULTISPECIES: A24 family peptidase [unclassified Polaromonas]|jgi:leader peptidase (prepilin peptidase)/N-methyltransferase|uniref:prepilin peptidase n=1 Tax=unclassified Polaromonas TaxID=2638319 RepID=UPI000BD7924F|nr:MULTISPECIES: A24 family peptidase [unclassified Polaromonas]OYY35940.1 MAG: prepilin peptidase [Polaromonas sp. 35-63-35]OYZ19756.1 MAG: prepilin peptidase [Polaromonas sp. 16-63-31]OYZ79977.1 MAG: prepilin peptidase [Polaromonas sp. 24-63-21]OZA52094.1 MAG: prepilin peptidase [Polaromonas sp. 17-63-33]OZA87874.1 MAG: prepilin peptidase [Polaromonas sp. 39-63-25]
MPGLALGLPAELNAALAGILGLLVGSFLNVVIYRLPKMMERQWAAECAELAGKAVDGTEKFNLMVPRSRCSNCGHMIAWYENIPLLSYLFLKGKCSVCGTKFGWRYPLVEAVTGALFFFCAWRWGLTATGLAWSGFAATLLALALIDWDTTLLPDDVTLPLLWAGLIVAALGWNPAVQLTDALWGTVAGYLSLWLVYWAFKLVTGKEGMGYGDFKLFAALGAWFGWSALVPMILMASVIGALVGIALKFSSGLREGGYVPFGPFLAGAGLTAMVFGPQSILRFIGL